MAFLADDLGVSVVSVPEIQREISALHDVRSAFQVAGDHAGDAPAHPPHAHGEGRGDRAGRPRCSQVTRGRRSSSTRSTATCSAGTSARCGRRCSARSSGRSPAPRTRSSRSAPRCATTWWSSGSLPPEKFVVVRLGIPLAERLDDESEDMDYRQLYGIPRDAFVVGWVGRMTGVKDTGAVLQRVRSASRARGEGGASASSATAPTESRWRSSHTSSGSRAPPTSPATSRDVAGFYRLFDAFFLPSVNEGTPVSAIEALATGTPVVANRVGGVPDVVRDGIDGFLVEPGTWRLRRRGWRSSRATRRYGRGSARLVASAFVRATRSRGSSTTSTVSTGRCSTRRLGDRAGRRVATRPGARRRAPGSASSRPSGPPRARRTPGPASPCRRGRTRPRAQRGSCGRAARAVPAR